MRFSVLGDRDEEGFEHPKQPVGDQSQQPEEENLDDALAVHRFVIELSRSSAMFRVWATA